MEFLTRSPNLMNMNGYIYKIVNKTNGKSYIGQTTVSVSSRWNAHCYKSSTCKLMKSAIEKYGKENFDVYCLFTVEDDSKEGLKNKLDVLEKQTIETENTLVPKGYNVLPGGRHGTFGYHHSAETIAKISSSNKGKKKTTEEINKRTASRQQYGYMSENGKNNVRNNHFRRSVVCNETQKTWSSVKECAESFGIKPKHFDRYMKGRKLKWRYTFCYVK